MFGSIVQILTIFFKYGKSIFGEVCKDGRLYPDQKITDWMHLGRNTWVHEKVQIKMKSDLSITLKNGVIKTQINSSNIQRDDYVRIGDCAIDLNALKNADK